MYLGALLLRHRHRAQAAPTYDDLVRERQRDLGSAATPKDKILEMFHPK